MAKLGISEAVIIGIVCVSAVLAAVFVILWYRHKTRQTMETMDQMLDAAIRGDFLESHFDESLLSAVETKLAHYLAASAVSARNLTEEKDKIKELIGDISHQTKTPLANILLYSQLLLEQDLSPSAKACVMPLNAQAEKLRFLIDALVKTSRLETGILSLQPERTSVAELLHTVMQQIRPLAEEKQLELSCVDTNTFARFDLKWTAEALYNLLDNAVKYTSEGSSVTIQVICYEFFCKITVTDTGIGISEEEHAKIFARFYRSPNVAKEQGVGIGLYLSRQIAAAEGGYLKVESKIGRGSAFSLFLPCANENLS